MHTVIYIWKRHDNRFYKTKCKKMLITEKLLFLWCKFCVNLILYISVPRIIKWKCVMLSWIHCAFGLKLNIFNTFLLNCLFTSIFSGFLIKRIFWIVYVCSKVKIIVLIKRNLKKYFWLKDKNHLFNKTKLEKVSSHFCAIGRNYSVFLLTSKIV